MNSAGNDKTYGIFDTAANRKIISDLNKSGANVFLFPPIETEKVEVNEAEMLLLTSLENFDWLIFADVFAVDYFLEILQELAIDAFELDNLRICALGETVSDRLRFASVHADVIPANLEMSEVLSALLNYIGESEISGLKFLFFTDVSEENNLVEKLTAKDAEAIQLAIYRTISNKSSELVKLNTLLKGGAVDEFIFTAPTDLIALKHYFKPEILAAVLAEIKISTSDGVMLQTAKESNLKRVSLFHLDKVDKVN